MSRQLTSAPCWRRLLGHLRFFDGQEQWRPSLVIRELGSTPFLSRHCTTAVPSPKATAKCKKEPKPGIHALSIVRSDSNLAIAASFLPSRISSRSCSRGVKLAPRESKTFRPARPSSLVGQRPSGEAARRGIGVGAPRDAAMSAERKPVPIWPNAVQTEMLESKWERPFETIARLCHRASYLEPRVATCNHLS